MMISSSGFSIDTVDCCFLQNKRKKGIVDNSSNLSAFPSGCNRVIRVATGKPMVACLPRIMVPGFGPFYRGSCRIAPLRRTLGGHPITVEQRRDIQGGFDNTGIVASNIYPHDKLYTLLKVTDNTLSNTCSLHASIFVSQ